MASRRRDIRTTLSNFLFRITGGRLGGGPAPAGGKRKRRDVSRPNPSIVRGGGND